MLQDGVNTLKKPFVDCLLAKAKEIPEIDGIVLFGSCLTENCRLDSDVDFFLVSKEKLYENVQYRERINAMLFECVAVQETQFDMLELESISRLEHDESFFLRTVRSEGYKYYPFKGCL